MRFRKSKINAHRVRVRSGRKAISFVLSCSIIMLVQLMMYTHLVEKHEAALAEDLLISAHDILDIQPRHQEVGLSQTTLSMITKNGAEASKVIADINDDDGENDDDVDDDDLPKYLDDDDRMENR